MICTRCQGTGFLNTHQLPDELLEEIEESAFKYLHTNIKYKAVKTDTWHDMVKKWIEAETDHDVSVCDCCGDSYDWYGEPGKHDYADFGKGGVYGYNGGLPECN